MPAANRSDLRVLVADPISEKGVELLRDTPGIDVTVRTGMSPDELTGVIEGYDALIVRSATRASGEVLGAARRLRAIGRAGTGVDNIDLEAATRAGVVVMNTPGGNSIAAAELTMSLLLSLARNVPQANRDLLEGRWERKKYMGTEVAGKTLGLVGLGRIGREVARRARSFRMGIIGFDPYVSEQLAADCGIRTVSLEQLIADADFISLHVPVSPDTRNLIDAETLGRMKPGACLINCARGALVDEDAVLAALESGKLGGAALDVFQSEPPQNQALIRHPKVVCTPHLGASTREAQERVGVEIASKIRDFLESGVILDAVNFPSIPREEYATLGPVMELAEQLGAFLSQIVEGGFQGLEVRTFGSLAAHPLRPVVMAATKGLLSPVLAGGVSHVNALIMASERGITVEESRSNEASRYAGLLRLTLKTDQGSTTVAGTLFESDRTRLVEVDGVPIESHPGGHMLFFRNRDVPGVVGQIGTLLGQAGINIAGIQLGRPQEGNHAVSIISVDSEVPQDVLTRIQALDPIVLVRTVVV